MRSKVINNTRLRKWAKSFANSLMILAIITGWLSMNSTVVQASTPVAVGYRDFTFPSGTGANDSPTGEKPESKLWWNDGFWWGSLWSRGANSYNIHRLDLSTQDWVDTGVAIDNRPGSRADALWDGSRLYVVSHLFVTSAVAASAGQRGQLYRYQYNASQKTYTLDPGFPVEVTRGKSETLVLEKDSSGTLWVTYVENQQVMVNRSLNNNDLTWGTPFALPAGTPTQVSSDDTASIITYNQHVGIMWSNQKTPKTMFFAVHPVGSPDTNWTRARAYTISSDDHMNLKALEVDQSGNVFAVVKTSKADATIVLLVCKNNLNRCKADGDWLSYPVYNSTYSPTRAILQIDISNRNLYIFAQAKDPSANRGIYYKKTSLDNIRFDATTIGTEFIKSTSDDQVNDPTSTKQIVNSTTGLVVLASDSGSNAYLHNYIDLSGGGSPTPTPSVTPTSTVTPTPTPSTTPSPTPGAGTPIKSITFENGSLVDPVSGADKVLGAVTLDNSSAVKGIYAARIANSGSSYLEETFTGVNQVYVSFYLKLNALPTTQTRILLISNAGTTVANLYLLTNGAIRLRNGSTTVGNSNPLALNTLYRVGVHQGAGSGGNATLDAYLAAGDQAFGSPFGTLTIGAWTTTADRLRIGSTLADPIDVTIDDILINSSVMPGPSAP